MKKANIITVHVGANFGSNLQAIATCRILERFDITPQIINYIPYRATWKGYFDCSGGILNIVRRLYSAPNKWRNDKIYNSFLAKHVKVSKAIYPWDDTILEDHVRINSLVQIAHGDKIGRFTEVAGSASIQGRVRIGENVWIGPGSVIRNGISIGDGARANMGAVVTRSIPSGEAVSGNFARSHALMIEEVRKYK